MKRNSLTVLFLLFCLACLAAAEAVIYVFQPFDRSIVYNDKVLVEGKAAGADVTNVLVEGIPVSLNEQGRFMVEVPLSPGKNLIVAEARDRTGLKVVTEVVAPEDVDLVAEYADVLQIGARNMHNYRLLSAVGMQPRPVLLKRGMMSTVDEMLLAAEYVVAGGNPRVVLCERGIRTFETSSPNTLDLCAVPILKERTHLPVIVDPSHAAGRREWVPALARAAVAAGADGLIVEVHPDPPSAASDGRQSLTPEGFVDLMDDLRTLADAVGRSLDSPEL